MKQQGLYRLTDQVYLVGTPAIIEKDRALFRDGTEKEWLDLFIAKGEMDVVPPVPTASITVVRDIAGRHNTFTDLRRKGRYFFADEGHHWRGVEVGPGERPRYLRLLRRRAVLADDVAAASRGHKSGGIVSAAN